MDKSYLAVSFFKARKQNDHGIRKLGWARFSAKRFGSDLFSAFWLSHVHSKGIRVSLGEGVGYLSPNKDDSKADRGGIRGKKAKRSLKHKILKQTREGKTNIIFREDKWVC